MSSTNPYITFIHDEQGWEYISPLNTKIEEKGQLKERLADIIEEGDYLAIHAKNVTLTNGELVQQLMDSPSMEYVFINDDPAQELIEHKKNAINNYGEEAYENDEYHDIIIEKIESGNLFTIVPKDKAIKHLVENDN